MKLNFPDKYNTAILLLISLCTLFPQPILADENLWSSNGPAGGSIKTIAIHPFDNQILYVGTIQNGIYKTTDRGENWTHLGSPNTKFAQRKIAFHPFGPDTMYAATVQGVFKSTNGGQAWNQILFPQDSYNEYSALFVHPEFPDLILAGGFWYDWMSTDGGQSWARPAIPQGTGMADVAVDPVNSDIIYLVGNTMSIGNGIWKSTDRGLTWDNIQNNIDTTGFGTSLAVDPEDTEVLYFTRVNIFVEYDSACVSKSTDGGQSWLDITPSDLSTAFVAVIRILAGEHNTVLIGTVEDGVLRSTDGGQSWEHSNSGLKVLGVASMEIDPLTGWIYLGTYHDGIYRSTDGGQSWLKISQSINSLECKNLAVNPHQPAIAFVATIAGLFRTGDSGLSWRYVEPGYPYAHRPGSAAFDNYLPDNVYVCSYYKSFYPNTRTGFYRSTDGGISWDLLYEGLPDDVGFVQMAISYLEPEVRRIFLTSSRGAYRSDDIGETWEFCTGGLPPDLYSEAIEVSPADPNIIAAGDTYNRVFISFDAGENWEQTTELPPGPVRHINDLEFHPAEPNILFAASYNIGLFRTTDYGATWESYNNDLPLDPSPPVVSGITINPLNPDNMFVASNHMGIYQSHNGGLHWESFNNGMDTTNPGGVMMFMPGDTTRLMIATLGRSVWSIERTVGITEDGGTLPLSVAIGAYPNPFNSRVRLSYALPAAGPAAVTIYDVTGRQVQSLFEGYRSAGDHEFIWDASSVASGIYFYRLQAAGERRTVKLTLLK